MDGQGLVTEEIVGLRQAVYVFDSDEGCGAATVSRCTSVMLCCAEFM